MHKLFPRFVKGGGAFALFVLRAVAGSAFVLHGSTKIRDPFHWMDHIPNVEPAPGVLQALAAVAEFGGGFALILGLFTPIAALAIGCSWISYNICVSITACRYICYVNSDFGCLVKTIKKMALMIGRLATQ
jgi:putative oxidoreductase